MSGPPSRIFSNEERLLASRVRSSTHPKPLELAENVTGEYKYLVEDIGNKLKDIMVEQGMSQVELGQRLGINEQHISRMLRGTRNINLQMLVRIGEELGVRFTIVPHKIDA